MTLAGDTIEPTHEGALVMMAGGGTVNGVPVRRRSHAFASVEDSTRDFWPVSPG